MNDDERNRKMREALKLITLAGISQIPVVGPVVEIGIGVFNIYRPDPEQDLERKQLKELISLVALLLPDPSLTAKMQGFADEVIVIDHGSGYLAHPPYEEKFGLGSSNNAMRQGLDHLGRTNGNPGGPVYIVSSGVDFSFSLDAESTSGTSAFGVSLMVMKDGMFIGEYIHIIVERGCAQVQRNGPGKRILLGTTAVGTRRRYHFQVTRKAGRMRFKVDDVVINTAHLDFSNLSLASGYTVGSDNTLMLHEWTLVVPRGALGGQRS